MGHSDDEQFIANEDILEVYECGAGGVESGDDAAEDGAQDDVVDHASVDESPDYDSTQHPGTEPLAVFTGHTSGSSSEDEVYAVAFCGRIVISGGSDDTLYFYTFSTASGLSVVHSERQDESVCCIRVRGNLVASGWMNGNVLIHLVSDSQVKLVAVLEGLEGEVTWIEWGGDSVLAVGGEDGSVWLWEITLESQTNYHVFGGTGSRSLCGVFSPDGNTLILGEESGQILISLWDKNGKNTVRKVHTGEPVISLCLHPIIKAFLVGTESGKIHRYPLLSGPTNNALNGHSESVEHICFSGNAFITTSLDGTASVLDEHNLAIRHSIQVGSPISCSAIHKDALIIGCTDGKVCVYNVRTGEHTGSFASNGAPVMDVAVGGCAFAVGTVAGQVRIYALQ